MALTLNQFVGFETGGTEEAWTTTGSPDATEATIVRSGNRALRMPAAATLFSSSVFSEVSDAGGDYIAGIGVYFETGVTPSVTSQFIQISDSGGLCLDLSLSTSGDLLVRDETQTTVTDGTISTPFSIDTWYYIEIYFQHSGTGSWEVFIDGSSVGSGSGEDFLGSGSLTTYTLSTNSGNDGAILFDDFYFLSGATAASDRLGPGVSVIGYQEFRNNQTVDFDNAGTASSGDSLDFNNWAAIFGIGWNDSTVGGYHATGQLDGAVEFKNSTAGSIDSPGPDAGSDIVSGTIKGAKWMTRGDRSGGSGTSHFLLYGSVAASGGNADLTISADLALLSGTINTYTFIQEGTVRVPAATDNFVMGLDKSSGGRDWDCYGMQAFLLHVSSVTVTDLSDGLMPEYPSPGLTVEV